MKRHKNDIKKLIKKRIGNSLNSHIFLEKDVNKIQTVHNKNVINNMSHIERDKLRTEGKLTNNIIVDISTLSKTDRNLLRQEGKSSLVEQPKEILNEQSKEQLLALKKLTLLKIVNPKKCKINYIIATWNGVRVKPVKNVQYYENILKNHIQILNNIPNSISQITIMKPESGVINSYYDINLNNKIKIIDCKNKYQSYGQWLKAVELFLDKFDYFIFIEDDYVPVTDNFDSKLIALYDEDSYLCSMVNDHCAISNGIISNNTIKKLLNKLDYDNWLKSNYVNRNENNKNYQFPFSKYFSDNGISLMDYRGYYLVDYFNGGNSKFVNYSFANSLYKEKIFTPIQNVIKY